MDGLFLGFIARELNAALTGARVEKVQQPEKDELLEKTILAMRAIEGKA